MVNLSGIFFVIGFVGVLILGLLALCIIGLITAILGFRRGLRLIARLVWSIIGIVLCSSIFVGILAGITTSLMYI